MRDQFYSDKHDLVKWGILHQLANVFGLNRIIQIAFYRPSDFPKIVIDNEEKTISQEIIAHFRDIRKICNINLKIRITVFDVLFTKPREKYIDAVKSFLSSFQHERCIVFLDPDTGLEPDRPNLEHVLLEEAYEIWQNLRPGDIYIFYQHRNRKGNWIAYNKSRLEKALNLTDDNLLKIAHVKNKPQKIPDVVFFYLQKPHRDQSILEAKTPRKKAEKAEPIYQPKSMKECPCGCKRIPERGIFMPGHDGRVSGWIREIERGAEPKDYYWEVGQIYREWVKRGKPGGKHPRIKNIVEELRSRGSV